MKGEDFYERIVRTTLESPVVLLYAAFLVTILTVLYITFGG